MIPRLLLIALLLTAFLKSAPPPGRVLIYRVTLHPISGGYPAVLDAPVLCGDRLLQRSEYVLQEGKMRVMCAPGEQVSTFLAAWVEIVDIQRTITLK